MLIIVLVCLCLVNKLRKESHKIKVGCKSFEKVIKFRYLEMALK